MARRKGVSVRQRRVSAELRSYREKRKLSCKDVAEALGCSESKISRMETGERGLYADDVAAVLGFLRVSGQARQELLALVRAGEERNWHEIGYQLPSMMKDLIRLEDEASVIRGYEPMLVPGLAQAPDYARALMRALSDRRTELEIDSMVAARMRRQLVLSRVDPPQVDLMMEEMVLRRTMGDPVTMYGQLQHLLAIAARRNVIVRVLPFDAVSSVATQGSLKILDFPDQPTLCYEESRTTCAFLEDEEYIATAKVVWKTMSAAALSEEDSRQLIADLADRMRSAM